MGPDGLRAVYEQRMAPLGLLMPLQWVAGGFVGAPLGLSLAASMIERPLIGQDDAVVVIGVLEVVFRQDAVARRSRVAREAEIFLVELMRRAAQPDARARTVEGGVAPALRLAAVAVAVVLVVMVPAAAVVIGSHCLGLSLGCGIGGRRGGTVAPKREAWRLGPEVKAQKCVALCYGRGVA